MNSKTCRKCGEEKETAEFPPHKATRDRLSSYCRGCHREAVRRHRAANREELNARRRVAPAFIFNPERMATVPNPDPRPKSKVR
jgi:hypothetical protein